MITCHKKYLIMRCAERGYKLADVMACVVNQDGDTWTIDPAHPAYPQLLPRLSSTTARAYTATAAPGKPALYVCDD
jgi:hypothetical protein